MSEKSKIMLTAEDGSKEVFFVLEKAEIAGGSYLLVTDSEEEEAEAYVLKEVAEEEEVIYEVIEDEKELMILSKYFEELLEDVDINLE